MLGDSEVPPVEGRQRVEAPGALDPRQIVEQRHTEEGPAAGAGVVLEHLDETIRIRVRQRPQKYPCTTLKTAVLAPTPSASVRTAARARMGVRRHVRHA